MAGNAFTALCCAAFCCTVSAAQLAGCSPKLQLVVVIPAHFLLWPGCCACMCCAVCVCGVVGQLYCARQHFIHRLCVAVVCVVCILGGNRIRSYPAALLHLASSQGVCTCMYLEHSRHQEVLMGQLDTGHVRPPVQLHGDPVIMVLCVLIFQGYGHIPRHANQPNPCWCMVCRTGLWADGEPSPFRCTCIAVKVPIQVLDMHRHPIPCIGAP